ncbi:unnamed protein product [Rotaria sordida]|uniref:ETS domain-containing protein n=1 Tax=Rotaria sordida TaxID=392033 RepID=A0A815Q256_9BILA|nr:unnamed protein product [Rotaria sordida]CAF4127398.1 unnamed protein product [Rotaria sordida]
MNQLPNSLFSLNVFDGYVGRTGSHEEKALESIDDLVAWLDQQPLLGTQLNDPLTTFLGDASMPLSTLLHIDRLTDQPEFDSIAVDLQVETQFAEYQQRNQDPIIGIDFEENLYPDVTFGSTVTNHMIPDINAQLTFDYDPSTLPVSTKKSQKKCQDRKSTELGYINLDEWFFIDESSGQLCRPKLLHQFFRRLLDNKDYVHIAAYVDKKQGIFKLYDGEAVAKLWQIVKGRKFKSVMTYKSLARGIRHCYKQKSLLKNPNHFTFQFGPASGFGTSWLPA